MKRTGWQSLVISSVVLWAMLAPCQTRPQYGGLLQLTLRANPLSLDPVELAQAGSLDAGNLTALIFDTLVAIEAAGSMRPALAESWRTGSGNQAQLKLRRGVTFHDGTPLTAEIVAASLRRANPAWNVRAEGDSLSIEADVPAAEVLRELSLARNAVVKRDSQNNVVGTGPFHISNWQPGKKLTLAAEEDYWGGRPFLDGIEIDLGSSYRRSATPESGKAELIEIAPEQIHRIAPDRFHVVRSNPMELLALRFAAEARSPEEKKVREALRLSLERRSMHNVLLQGAGEPTASLLPSWISGYGFVFPVEADRAKAQGLRDQVPGVPKLSIGYAPDDPLGRLLAERIALNARDVGLAVQVNANASELRLVRITIASSDPQTALGECLRQLGLTADLSKTYSLEDVYGAESSVLAADRVIPLFHLPAVYASTGDVRDWTIHSDGTLDLSAAWIRSKQP